MGDITVGRDTRRLRQEITVMRKIIIPFIILFLAACTTPGKRGRMHELLLQAQRQNQEYTPFTSDSIGKVLVEYYDRYGNANEQMLAHYLLGCRRNKSHRYLEQRNSRFWYISI